MFHELHDIAPPQLPAQPRESILLPRIERAHPRRHNLFVLVDDASDQLLSCRGDRHERNPAALPIFSRAFLEVQLHVIGLRRQPAPVATYCARLLQLLEDQRDVLLGAVEFRAQ
jgi:hypothetical protein